jgi:hypothetical protein
MWQAKLKALKFGLWVDLFSYDGSVASQNLNCVQTPQKILNEPVEDLQKKQQKYYKKEMKDDEEERCGGGGERQR